jgi:hypothetical protein
MVHLAPVQNPSADRATSTESAFGVPLDIVTTLDRSTLWPTGLFKNTSEHAGQRIIMCELNARYSAFSEQSMWT